MNEDSPGGIRSSHSELEAQHAEPGPAVGGHVPADSFYMV